MSSGHRRLNDNGSVRRFHHALNAKLPICPSRVFPDTFLQFFGCPIDVAGCPVAQRVAPAEKSRTRLVIRDVRRTQECERRCCIG
jgi:hypothetical protein